MATSLFLPVIDCANIIVTCHLRAVHACALVFITFLHFDHSPNFHPIFFHLQITQSARESHYCMYDVTEYSERTSREKVSEGWGWLEWRLSQPHASNLWSNNSMKQYQSRVHISSLLPQSVPFRLELESLDWRGMSTPKESERERERESTALIKCPSFRLSFVLPGLITSCW